MLSRVADALFWMSRYLERAEHVARLLDVCFHLELDLGGLVTGPHELHWTALAAILQQVIPPNRQAAAPQATISHWLMFDLENPSSIVSCVTRARNNARGIRGSITSEMWRELNKLYWQLADGDFAAHARESPHDYFEAVECGSQLFQGVCDATLTHDEGWQFIQLGKYLERADKTLRILDIQYQLLHQMTDPHDLPLSNLEWAGVLRSCRAYESFQRLYVGRVEPEHVVEFLLFHPEFPRSARFCLEAASVSLEQLEGSDRGGAQSRACRVLGRVLADLKFADADQVCKQDLHGFLAAVQDRCAQVSRAVQAQYSLR